MRKFKTNKDDIGVVEGFQITLNNNITVSVQFGQFNICDGGENTAEVEVWDDNGDRIALDENNNHMSLIKTNDYGLMGDCTPEMVVSILKLAKEL